MADTEYEVIVGPIFATEDEACDWGRQFAGHGYTVRRRTFETTGKTRYTSSEVPVLIVGPQGG